MKWRKTDMKAYESQNEESTRPEKEGGKDTDGLFVEDTGDNPGGNEE